MNHRIDNGFPDDVRRILVPFNPLATFDRSTQTDILQNELYRIVDLIWQAAIDLGLIQKDTFACSFETGRLYAGMTEFRNDLGMVMKQQTTRHG